MPEKQLITSEDRLLRRVQFLDPNFIKPDGSPASSSFTLKKGEDGLSVDVERLTTYEKSIQDINRFRLFALQASFTESLGLENEHDPLPDNEAHALIKGGINKPTARKLAAEAAKNRIKYPD